MWSALPKTQKFDVTLSYSPCEDTPTLCSNCRHHSCNDRWSIATTMYRKGEYGNKKEYFCNVTTRLWVFDSALHIKKSLPFLGPRRCNRFFEIKARELPFTCTSKTSVNLHEVAVNRLVPLFFGWTSFFRKSAFLRKIAFKRQIFFLWKRSGLMQRILVWHFRQCQWRYAI